MLDFSGKMDCGDKRLDTHTSFMSALSFLGRKEGLVSTVILSLEGEESEGLMEIEDIFSDNGTYSESKVIATKWKTLKTFGKEVLMGTLK